MNQKKHRGWASDEHPKPITYIQKVKDEPNMNPKKKFKRGCIYYNTATNRPERVLTITAKTVGTKAGAWCGIEIHARGDFRSPSVAEIRAFLGHSGKFAKTALVITDAETTALAYGDKVMTFANSEPRLASILAAVESGNNRSLGQLIRKRKKAQKKSVGIRAMNTPTL